MNYIVILLCSFSFILTCHGALKQKYFAQNVHNYFPLHYESQLFHSSSRSERNGEDFGKLTTSLLHDIHIRAGKGLNIILSPVSVWMILAMLLEGATGKTETELKAKLHLSYGSREGGKQIIRNRYKEINSTGKNSPTEFVHLNFVVSDKAKAINPEFKKIIGEFYNGRHFEMETGKSENDLSRMINTWASQATKNRIHTLVSPAMLNELLLVIGNAAYFKSKWKYPFDPSQTFFLPFKDEFEKPIKNVPMMTQVVVLPYVYNWHLESEIVEIPYDDNSTSMFVILPREKIPLKEVLYKMKYLDLNQIIPKNFSEETVQLFLPRFHIELKMYLNEILQQDLRTMFSPNDAKFPQIGKNIFVSKVYHKAEIENTEEGTVASAVSSVQFAYKSSSTMFKANRPFIYLIADMKKRIILFAGTYSNPFIG